MSEELTSNEALDALVKKVKLVSDGADAPTKAVYLLCVNAIEALQRERGLYRHLLIDAGRASGAFLSESVSLDFLREVPHEIRLVKERLIREKKAARTVTREQQEAAEEAVNEYANALDWQKLRAYAIVEVVIEALKESDDAK